SRTAHEGLSETNSDAQVDFPLPLMPTVTTASIRCLLCVALGKRGSAWTRTPSQGCSRRAPCFPRSSALLCLGAGGRPSGFRRWSAPFRRVCGLPVHADCSCQGRG